MEFIINFLRMSILALLTDQVNPVADFYAGYAEHSVGVKMIDELRDCMLRDDEATYTWD